MIGESEFTTSRISSICRAVQDESVDHFRLFAHFGRKHQWAFGDFRAGMVAQSPWTVLHVFSHHAAAFIRLAYADDLEGPWHIYERGTLQLSDAEAFCDHIGSPDVHIDHASRQIRMYFHGPAKEKPGQWTGVAYSSDGIHFTAKPDLLGKSYFRVWQWQGDWYALAKNNNEGWGELYRSPHPDGTFELRGNFLKGMRHAAVLVEGHWLRIFYSRVGDAPERILMASVDLRGDWLDWQPTEPVEVIRPSEDYEGISYPVMPLRHGAAIGVQQLRDPFVILEEKITLMFYTVAGETAICGASISLNIRSY